MPEASELLWTVLWIMAIGVAALLLGYLVARQIRKRLAEGSVGDAFTLQDLRDMRAAGSITHLEYEAMKASILEGLRPGPERPASIGPPGGGNDPEPAPPGGRKRFAGASSPRRLSDETV